MNNIDDRILEEIKNDAENIQIPESLSPDNMMAKIAKKKSEGYFEESIQEEKKNRKKNKISKKIIAWTTGGVATIVAAASLGIILLGSGATKSYDRDINIYSGDLYNSIAEDEFSDEDKVENLSSYETLAQYYISKNTMRRKLSASEKLGNLLSEIFGGSIKGDASLDEDYLYNDSFTDGSLNGCIPEMEMNEGAIDDVAKPDYSDTNTRTENVSEADIVKTDGEYIYCLNNKVGYSAEEYWNLTITIVKADGENSEKVSVIPVKEQLDKVARWELPIDYGNYEMMLYNDKLVVVCSNESYTVLLFYDITDKSAVKHENSLYIQGEYDSCRMVDGYLYVFADRYIEDKVNEYGEYIGISMERTIKNIIPCSSQGDVPEEDVYISKCEDFNMYHMIGTVDMNNTSDFMQVKAVLGSNSGTVYVSANNIYYVSRVYEGYEDCKVGEVIQCSDKSELIKLSYKDGFVEAAGRTVIDGEAGDEFAIDEYNGYLRMAVTVQRWNGICAERNVEYFNGSEWIDDKRKVIELSYMTNDQMSALYVLDEDLNVVGSIPNLKEDESVYGVRFDGDIAYVVTYRQMDPLFTIDLSDPTNPTVLGALKIPGFSTYLHKWDDNKLIGIGYDDDWQVKISTFDITDKTDVKETDVCYVDSYGTDALYNHKALFISSKNNLVGFMDNGGYYRIFSYVDGVLTEVIETEIEDYIGNDVRGLYIGEYIYIAAENNGVYVYRMNDYEMLTVIK
ncbi:MAG: beta-propeller domain-containing protein [Lachnospiraceae bacterium]|nr:beta-propeller domain-containing protein [Lachnospiraceae bacterium]